MNCLACQQPIIEQRSWQNILLLPAEKKMCSQCEQQLTRISQPTCSYCGRNDTLDCQDCQRWVTKVVLQQNRAVYRYNPFLKEIIARFKYRGDYQLIDMFNKELKHAFHSHYNQLKATALAVPIPLSNARLQARCFNQAEAIAQRLPLSISNLLIRTEGEKQAKKNRKARLAMANPFMLSPQPTSKDRAIVIIDDIYTTGATIHHAASTLFENGYHNVYSFTLAR
ncbi:competence protein ComFC [Amphibacillus marinus]|uniref:Competence protein ComFC n=1 Tax=Amphibacillus marinus TaxID=872970 RepID=A0A1H8QY80_9BACI|nr:ComF family protein [Amphibacillus marinus]SEO58971.1 competence protein ComFC [Amphibacillus marinus]